MNHKVTIYSEVAPPLTLEAEHVYLGTEDSIGGPLISFQGSVVYVNPKARAVYVQLIPTGDVNSTAKQVSEQVKDTFVRAWRAAQSTTPGSSL